MESASGHSKAQEIDYIFWLNLGLLTCKPNEGTPDIRQHALSILTARKYTLIPTQFIAPNQIVCPCKIYLLVARSMPYFLTDGDNGHVVGFLFFQHRAQTLDLTHETQDKLMTRTARHSGYAP